MRFGPWEIVLVVFVILILFGARRIPELMKSLGLGIKEFKSGLNEEKGKDTTAQQDENQDNSTKKS